MSVAIQHMLGDQQALSSSFLSKFDLVEVTAVTRLGEADLTFCQHQQMLYVEAMNILKQVIQLMQDAYKRYIRIDSYNNDGYIDSSDDIRRTNERIHEIRKNHINRICGHFQHKYKVTINTTAITNKVKDDQPADLTYQFVVEEIFVQLGGFTFEEKAIKEIKDRFVDKLYSWKEPKVKGTRLIIDGFISIDQWDKKYGKIRLHYNSNDNIYSLFQVLSLHETGFKEMTHYYSELYQYLDRNKDDAIRTHDIGFNQVQTIKFFQNGKTEVNFESFEQAEKFRIGYCQTIK
jgi:hypothetical protein